jgi:hypothetical protein
MSATFENTPHIAAFSHLQHLAYFVNGNVQINIAWCVLVVRQNDDNPEPCFLPPRNTLRLHNWSSLRSRITISIQNPTHRLSSL